MQIEMTARRFDFRKLVRAHGWAFLSPFEWSDKARVLCRPLRLPDGQCVPVQIRAATRSGKSVVQVSTNAHLSTAELQVLRPQVRRMLCLDQDFSGFHAMCRGDPVLGFVSRVRFGGLLRAPTAFEDMVKTVCTTNCDWRNTKKMSEALCALDGGGFPTPELVLKHPAWQLAARIPLGYRAATVRTIARLTADGKLLLDEWAAASDWDRIRSSLAAIKGVGPYSINHMLVLLGWYGDIPVDSEVLKYLQDTHFDGQAVAAKKATQPYERYGEYRFLAYKCHRMARRLNYINK
jgi:3-methyladenine DNA glycosylase/8-oxoguanine DNA glycosylase